MESYGEGYEEYLPAGGATGAEAAGRAEASDSRRKQVQMNITSMNDT